MRHPQTLLISCRNAAALIALICVTAGVAAAAGEPAVILLWTQKNGTSIVPPSNEVVAQQGDQLVLQVQVDPGAAGLEEFGFSVRFDERGLKELDLNAYDDPPSGDQGGWVYVFDNWPLATQNSVRDPGADDAWGQVGSYQACTNPLIGFCDEGVGQISSLVTVGTITLDVTEYVAANGTDIQAGRFNITSEIFVAEYQNQLPVELCLDTPDDECTEIVFGTATVPEPGHAALQLGACLTLAALARPVAARRRRRFTSSKNSA